MPFGGFSTSLVRGLIRLRPVSPPVLIAADSRSGTSPMGDPMAACSPLLPLPLPAPLGWGYGKAGVPRGGSRGFPVGTRDPGCPNGGGGVYCHSNLRLNTHYRPSGSSPAAGGPRECDNLQSRGGSRGSSSAVAAPEGDSGSAGGLRRVPASPFRRTLQPPLSMVRPPRGAAMPRPLRFQGRGWAAHEYA